MTASRRYYARLAVEPVDERLLTWRAWGHVALSDPYVVVGVEAEKIGSRAAIVAAFDKGAADCLSVAARQAKGEGQ